MDMNGISITSSGEIIRRDGSELAEPQTKREREDIISTFEFFRLISDEAAAIAFFENLFWGDAPICPRCDSENIHHTKSGKPMPYRCRDCRGYFNVKTNTVMSNSQIPLNKWLYAIYLLLTSRMGVSAKRLEKELGLTYKSAWFLAHRIREAMQYPGPMLAGEVEIDETFIGSKGRRKHFLKREEDREKREWGIPTHEMVLGMKERGGNVIAFPIGNRSTETLAQAISENVEADSTIYTDGHAAYRNVEGYEHEWVNHRMKEYVRGDVHTNSIESFWALVKRGYTGVYFYMSIRHLFRYMAEFSHRHNTGPGNGLDTIGKTCLGMRGKRLTYKELTFGYSVDELLDLMTPADDGELDEPPEPLFDEKMLKKLEADVTASASGSQSTPH